MSPEERPSGAMSAFVTTARVRSPVLSTCLDMRMDSHVVKSTVADRTLRIIDS
ncbi:hypothetical protein AXX17_AT1G53580 [Arabidopsis thaliana]|uniref:Uncharacterized protein n=1 Tax=Arabidopsis thaliana TaxID=3702 RepID=A0A178WHL7_ARATH|nr:hypothetical protein AXX17_AT1G53580 [Arabidopsis thaliana]